jgi:hypothetical protein
MTLRSELARSSPDHFVTLVLDNEVTVGEFVVSPPLSWARLVRRDGVFRVAEGYPNVLTAAQAKFEMRNWDEVSLPSIMRALEDPMDDGVDYVLFGNNAGQGLPLAQSLAPNMIADRAAIIYANSLPQKKAYEQIGYRTFFCRSEAVFHLLQLADNAGRRLALGFINTIQHNEFNYHDP